MGYDEGAFTDAKKGGKAGLFERTHNGTIFLDEINQMSLPLQSKILRVIQEKAVMRVGGDRVIPVNVRIIAASNESLAEKVVAGTFRSDLYYRINVLSLRLPPLRERREDVPVLIRHFCARMRAGNPLAASIGADKIYGPVADYHWPGNVRELQNYVERCLVLGTAGLDRSFFAEFVGAIPAAPKKEKTENDNHVELTVSTLEEMERQLVQAVVSRCGGNKSQAALLLDINRNTVNKKLRTLS